MTDEAPTDDGSTTTRPGGEGPRQPRCTGAESDRRVGELIAMMHQGKGRTRELRAHGVEVWGISRRQTDYYIAKARKELREDMEAEVGDCRAELGGWLRECYKKAIEDGDPKAGIAAVQAMAKLLGLYGPNASKIGAEDADAKARRLLGGVYEVEPGAIDASHPIDDYEDDGEDEFDDEEE